MTQAKPPNITASPRVPHEPAFTLDEMAAAVAASAPSILELGNHLADTERAHAAFDSAFDDSGRLAAMEILDLRRNAVRALIVTLPAQTIQDAAVQVEAVAQETCCLAASRFTPEETERMADRIERVLLGILPIVAQTAGLDLNVMRWADTAALRVSRFAGVGVWS